MPRESETFLRHLEGKYWRLTDSMSDEDIEAENLSNEGHSQREEEWNLAAPIENSAPVIAHVDELSPVD